MLGSPSSPLSPSVNDNDNKMERIRAMQRLATLLGSTILGRSNERNHASSSFVSTSSSTSDDNHKYEDENNMEDNDECIAVMNRVQKAAISAMFVPLEDDKKECKNDRIIGSFPSLLLKANICPNKLQQRQHQHEKNVEGEGVKGGDSLQVLESMAVRSLSCPIIVHSHPNNDHDENDCMYQLSNITDIPHELLSNLNISFTQLLRARTKAYAILLLRHYTNTMQQSSKLADKCDDLDNDVRSDDDPVVDAVIELLTRQTYVENSVTSYQGEECLEEDKDSGDIKLRLKYKVLFDTSIFGFKQSICLESDGSIYGKFVDSPQNLLEYVCIKLDTGVLLHQMKHEIMEVVDRAMFTIKHSKGVTSSSSNTSDQTSEDVTIEDEEQQCLQKIDNLQQSQLEDVLDCVLSIAEELNLKEVKQSDQVMRRSTSMIEMPPPMPRKPKVESISNKCQTQMKKKRLASFNQGQEHGYRSQNCYEQSFAYISPDLSARNGDHSVPAGLLLTPSINTTTSSRKRKKMKQEF